MRRMTESEKSEIACDVSIELNCSDEPDVLDRFSKLKDCLKERGLEPKISKGYYYGECLTLTCDGTISLLDAESIAAKDDVYVLPIFVRYYPGKGFVLTN